MADSLVFQPVESIYMLYVFVFLGIKISVGETSHAHWTFSIEISHQHIVQHWTIIMQEGQDEQSQRGLVEPLV